MELCIPYEVAREGAGVDIGLAFAEALAANTALHSINLASLGMGDVAGSRLVDSLSANTSLEEASPCGGCCATELPLPVDWIGFRF